MKQWKGNTGGMPWMQRTLIRWLSVLDPRVIYGVLLFVVPFYMLFGHKGYVAQYRWFRQCFGESPLRAFCHTYLNHFEFGRVVIDRFAAFGGRHFDLLLDDGHADYQRLSNGDEGFLVLSSHVGNYELSGYQLKQPLKQLYALVYLGETETMMQNRARLFAPNGVVMVPVVPDMSHIFELNNALRDGHIASIPGDRVFGSSKTLQVSFFGRQVSLPLGPFSLAVARNVPVIAVFVMKENWHSYRVFTPCYRPGFSSDEKLTKQQRQQHMAQWFASELERMMRRYPTQWYNYFDFFAPPSNN